MKWSLQFGCSVVCTVFALVAYQQWNTDPQQAYACVVLAIFMVVVGITLRTD